jgi:hypothetical protein
MAFNGNFMWTSFKKELMQGAHNFLNSGGNTFKIALFTNAQAGNDNLGGTSTDMDETITNYSSSAANEVPTSGTYPAANTLGRVDPASGGTTAFTDFNDITFTSTTITARGALIYNDDTVATPGVIEADAAVVVLDFGTDKGSTSGDFQIVFPTADATNALIRIA